ncbi:hypothetical protein FRC07_001361 [Ceratobasidium sp. 392]|nr:hypothetical protein FRC07_001361 [Ceratobasidium sp. 392]
MSNNLASTDKSDLPYYVATFKGRFVAIKRDVDYQNTIKLVQKSIPKLRAADSRDIFISTSLSDYSDAMVQISEEIWPDIVSSVKTVEIALEGDDDESLDLATTRTGSVTWNPRLEGVTGQSLLSQTLTSSIRATKAPNNRPIHPGTIISATVRTPSQKLLEFGDLRSTTTIREVKLLIETEHNVPAALQILRLATKHLDDSKTLAHYDISSSTIIDLIVNARKSMIYLIPGWEAPQAYGYQYGRRRATYQNVEVQLSLNQSWEVAAHRLSRGLPSKDYIHTAAWTVDVAPDKRLWEQSSKAEMTYLFWDGITHLARPPQGPLIELSPSDRNGSPSFPLLDPQNSVAVELSQLESYLKNVFRSFGFDTGVNLGHCATWLKQTSYEYLALRFVPEVECKETASLSVSLPTDLIARVLVLYKGLDAVSAEAWNNTGPSAAQGAIIWKEICGTTSVYLTNNSNYLQLGVIEISWMEVS